MAAAFSFAPLPDCPAGFPNSAGGNRAPTPIAPTVRRKRRRVPQHSADPQLACPIRISSTGADYIGRNLRRSLFLFTAGLVKFRVFGFRLLQHRYIRVGVLPKREEILISSTAG